MKIPWKTGFFRFLFWIFREKRFFLTFWKFREKRVFFDFFYFCSIFVKKNIRYTRFLCSPANNSKLIIKLVFLTSKQFVACASRTFCYWVNDFSWNIKNTNEESFSSFSFKHKNLLIKKRQFLWGISSKSNNKKKFIHVIREFELTAPPLSAIFRKNKGGQLLTYLPFSLFSL